MHVLPGKAKERAAEAETANKELLANLKELNHNLKITGCARHHAHDTTTPRTTPAPVKTSFCRETTHAHYTVRGNVSCGSFCVCLHREKALTKREVSTVPAPQ